ncbi:hypothetical protein TPHA_0B01690 [Tetrapisispora phaffii CBS 4417]|uniref:RBR-type E3 ubiquitin transferase n=1 Tax=Tetrapisispora phaffii (strain ATCC 24235 / CBS 4417 / NBRC 1672 / NRRL Y-8282 / UCD 70-5) TaxID=1071381 RepID=G8BPB1_TETPH|nr:hypothetical protein TPHA_0B01690 [Tetrapisispora phaffii CBS 4417]CCE61842.1 hypothetical protein TPHA_0B01690 [Tetrapisispora phaffii CBS 4417]
MEDRVNLKDDLAILRDMYPELVLDQDEKSINTNIQNVVSGYLPFKVSLHNNLSVSYEKELLTFSSFLLGVLQFKIDVAKYPSLKDSLELNFISEWMTKEDKNIIISSLDEQFGDLTDPTSDIYDPFTPILMLLFSYLTDETASVLFPDNVKKCLTLEEYQIFKIMKSTIQKEEASKKNFTCCICIDTKKGTNIIELPCKEETKHYLCEPCVKSYYSEMIKEGNMDAVRCPECKYEEIVLDSFKDYTLLKETLFTPAIPFEFFDRVLSEELCTKYRELFHSYCATKLSKHSTSACIPCRRCNTWCVKDNLDDAMISCKTCSFVFCFNCLHSWHGYNNLCGAKVTIPREVIEAYIDEDGILSDDAKKEMEVKYGKKQLATDVSDYLADQLLDLAIAEKDSNLQRCPHCRIVVQRSEGCNKMRCAVCNCLFCFICGTLLYPEDPYEHFREVWSECYGRLFEGMEGVDS